MLAARQDGDGISSLLSRDRRVHDPMAKTHPRRRPDPETPGHIRDVRGSKAKAIVWVHKADIETLILLAEKVCDLASHKSPAVAIVRTRGFVSS